MTLSSSGRASLRLYGEDPANVDGIITGPTTVTFPTFPWQLMDQLPKGYALLVSADGGQSAQQFEITGVEAHCLAGSDHGSLSVTLAAAVPDPAVNHLKVTQEEFLAALKDHRGDIGTALAGLGLAPSAEPLAEPADVEVRTLSADVHPVIHSDVVPLGLTFCDISPFCIVPREEDPIA